MTLGRSFGLQLGSRRPIFVVKKRFFFVRFSAKNLYSGVLFCNQRVFYVINFKKKISTRADQHVL